jgi:hypothetical protein
MQARFLVGRQSVLVPQPSRRMGLVLVVPVARHLLVVLVKLGMTLLVSPILCKNRAAGQGQNRGGSHSQQPMCFHKHPLFHLMISVQGLPFSTESYVEVGTLEHARYRSGENGDACGI